MAVHVRQPRPLSHRRRLARQLAYSRILVPVVDQVSEEAIAIACGLARNRRASVTAVGVIEVPLELPLNAHMPEEEATLRAVLAEAAAIGELHGVIVQTKIERGRTAGEAIVDDALLTGSEIIVLSAPRKKRASARSRTFGSTVVHVLKHAPCRVMVAATPA